MAYDPGSFEISRQKMRDAFVVSNMSFSALFETLEMENESIGTNHSSGKAGFSFEMEHVRAALPRISAGARLFSFYGRMGC